MTELLRVEGLVAGYGEAVVIQGLSLSVRAGQTLALLGRNGTGKTTLINTLVGTTRRFAGQIWLDGQAIEGWPSHRRVTGLTKGGLGWVPQERGVFKSLTVHENLSAVARAVHGVHAWTPSGSSPCFLDWPSAATTWAHSSQGASNRCWRWDGPSW